MKATTEEMDGFLDLLEQAAVIDKSHDLPTIRAIRAAIIERDELKELHQVTHDALVQRNSEISQIKAKLGDGQWLGEKAGELSTYNFANQHPEVAYEWLMQFIRDLAAEGEKNGNT